MNLTCAPAPPNINEFEAAGLTHAPSRLVGRPRVLESPVNFECKVHIDRRLVAGGVFDALAARPIERAGGLGDDFAISPPDKFHMRRPPWPIA
jgi:hypothetical protein